MLLLLLEGLVVHFNNITHVCLLDITMPPVMKKRGRPKGFEVTVIGLPAKKVCKGGAKNQPAKRKVVPFIKLHTSIKERGIPASTDMCNIHSNAHAFVPPPTHKHT